MAAAVLAAHRNMATASSPSHEEVEQIQDDGAHDAIPLLSWSVQQVCAWLLSLGWQELAATVQKADIDGATLIELDAAGWAELGVRSAVERAKLNAAVKAIAETSKSLGRYAEESPSPRQQPGSQPGGHQRVPRRPTASEKKLVDHFLKPGSCPGCFWASTARTPEGGAEHTRDWITSIVNAHVSGGEAKEHFLRFLGMYNVIDLLVFTIDMTYVMSLEISGSGAQSMVQVIILVLVGVSAAKTGIGMVLSTILYNTCSACSVENFLVFAKMPTSTRALKLVNDLSIYGSLWLVFTLPLVLYRIAIENHAGWAHAENVLTDHANATLTSSLFPVAPQWQYAVAVVVVPVVWFLTVFGGFAENVPAFTHLAMYGGLFSASPFGPQASDPGWVHRSSPEEVMDAVAAHAMDVGSDPKTCQHDCAEMYGRLARESMAGAAEEELQSAGLFAGLVDGDGNERGFGQRTSAAALGLLVQGLAGAFVGGGGKSMQVMPAPPAGRMSRSTTRGVLGGWAH